MIAMVENPGLILVDDLTAVMTRATLERLPEYSCSVPTGVAVGKRWRRREPSPFVRHPEGTEFRWVLGEYVLEADAGRVVIAWREILLVED